MTTLKELIERVEKAKRPDREIDYAVLEAVGYVYDRYGKSWWRGNEWIENTALTASVDAVIALIGEKMPGWFARLDGPRAAGPNWRAELHPEDGYSPLPHSWGPTPALALLLAFIRAMEARGDG